MATPTRTRRTARPVPTFDHLAKKPPIELRDVIPLDQDAASAYQQAKNEVETAELLGDADRLKTARTALRTARDRLEATSVEVVFRSVGRPLYEQLKRDHPPTEAQTVEYKREYNEAPEFNVDTFPQVLIAASCIQPKMTPEQVESLITEHGWNAGEFNHLFQLALRVNTQRRSVDWGN